MRNLNELSKAAHENAVNHGWWAENPSDEQILMLVVTEIAEMVEADRKGRTIGGGKGHNAVQSGVLDAIKTSENFTAAFESYVKDTVEDEMADVAIRLLDLAGRKGMDFDRMAACRYHRAFDKFTFAENAFALTKGICRENINIFKRIQFGLFYVIEWARQRGIMLDWHVKQKMRYNAGRPFKHGKKY